MELGECVLNVGVEGGLMERHKGVCKGPHSGEHLGHSRPMFLQSFGLTLVEFGFKCGSSTGAGGDVPALHRPWGTDGGFRLIVRFVLLPFHKQCGSMLCNNPCTCD